MNTKKSSRTTDHSNSVKTNFALKNDSLQIALQRLCASVPLVLTPLAASALPEGGQVSAGSAAINASGNQMVVNQASERAVIDWRSYNVGAAESVRYNQPGASSIALNRVDPAQGVSHIFGSISANGQVWLINPAGVYFGPTSRVNVAGIVASTANISNEDFMAGQYRFRQDPNYNGAVINDGSIVAAKAGLVALVGNGVVNNGRIEAEGGTVVLGASKKFTVDFTGDQLIQFEVGGEVDRYAKDQNGNDLDAGVKNAGAVIAKAGKVVMTAQAAGAVLDRAINMKGVVVANSAHMNKAGEIILGGGDGTVYVSGKMYASAKRGSGHRGGTIKVLAKRVAITDKARINASGDTGGGEILIGGNARGAGPEQNAVQTYVGPEVKLAANAITHGDGGKVVVWGDDTTQFYGDISAKGGEQSGNGGWVETSGKAFLEALGNVDASAANGAAGQWLLDPWNVTISGATSNGTFPIGPNPRIFTPTSSGATVSNIGIQNSLNGGTSVTITTGSTGAEAGDITVSSSITKGSGTDATLTLQAARNIIVNAAITNSSANLFNVVLQAGLTDATGSITANANINIGGSGPGGAFTATSGSAGSITYNKNIATGNGPTVGGNFTSTSGSGGTTISNGAAIYTGAGTLTINGGGGPVQATGSSLTTTSTTTNAITIQNVSTATLGSIKFPGNGTAAVAVKVLANDIVVAPSAIIQKTSGGSAVLSLQASHDLTVSAGATIQSLGNALGMAFVAGNNATVNQSLTTTNGGFALTGGATGTTTIASGVTIDSGNGAITINGGGGAVQLAGSTLINTNATANAIRILNASTVNLGVLTASSPTGAVTLGSSNNISGAVTQAVGGKITANTLTISTNNSVNLNNANVITNLGVISTTGDVTIRNTTSLNVNEAITTLGGSLNIIVPTNTGTINFANATSTVDTLSGNIKLTSNILDMNNAANKLLTTGDIYITTNSFTPVAGVQIGGNAALTVNANQVIIGPGTASFPTIFASTTTPINTLLLPASTLNLIRANAVRIGDDGSHLFNTTTGNITVNAYNASSNFGNDLSFLTTGNITQTGTLQRSGGPLFNVAFTGNDVTLNGAIQTQGGNISVTGNNNVTINGTLTPVNGNVSISGINGIITLGSSINVGSGFLTVLGGNLVSSGKTFTGHNITFMGGDYSGFTGNSLVGLGANNSLVLANITSRVWSISGVDLGSIVTSGSTINFSNMQNIHDQNTPYLGVIAGTTGTFAFTDSGSLSGTLDGTGAVTILDLSALNNSKILSIDFQSPALGTLTANGTPLMANFVGIENIDGNSNTANEIFSPDTANNIWAITTDNNVRLHADDNSYNLTLISIPVLHGGALNDEFIFFDDANAADFVGTLDGGAGTNTIFEQNSATWNIAGTNSGTIQPNLVGLVTFSNIQNLTGGNDTDVFTFANGASISGQIDGNGCLSNPGLCSGVTMGPDTINLSALTSSVSVDLTTGAVTVGGNPLMGQGFINIDTVMANAAQANFVTGPAAGTTWVISGVDTLTIGSTDYQNFNHLVGGAGNDTFDVQVGGNITGSISGGGGDDTFTIASDIATPFTGILDGGDGDDIFDISRTVTNNIIGGNDDDTFTVESNGVVQTISGEAGEDRITNNGTVNGSLLGGDDDDVIINNSANPVNTMDGGNGNDALSNTAGSTVNTMTGGDGDDLITNSGTVATILGGNGNDSIINDVGGTVTSLVDGGSGNNSFSVYDPSVWTVSGTNSGTVNLSTPQPDISFQNIQNLIGSTGADTFAFTDTGRIVGGVDGNGGIDTLDLTAITPFITVNLQANTITANFSPTPVILIGGSIDNVAFVTAKAANALQNNIIGSNNGHTWELVGLNSVKIDNTTTYNNFAQLQGGSGIDNFIIEPTGNIQGTINGGAGQDNFTIQNGANFTGTLSGGDDNDTFDNDGTVTLMNGDGGNDHFINHVNGNITTINGGDGIDTLDNDGFVGTFNGGEGNDVVNNDSGGVITTVNGGNGNDEVNNQGTITTVNGDGGNDEINNLPGGTITTVNGGDGNDTINNQGTITTINGDGGNDEINNLPGGTVTVINGGDGNDEINNGGHVLTDINGGNGDDTITVTDNGDVDGDINGGAGKDTITVSDNGNVDGDINGGDDKDTITVTDDGHVGGDINGDAGDDTINVTGDGDVDGDINGGDGDDTITISDDGNVDGDVNGDEGDDKITVKDDGNVGDDINGGGGDDFIDIEDRGKVGGRINGDDGDDTIKLDIPGVTVGGPIDGGPGITIIIVPPGTPVVPSGPGDGTVGGIPYRNITRIIFEGQTPSVPFNLSQSLVALAGNVQQQARPAGDDADADIYDFLLNSDLLNDDLLGLDDSINMGYTINAMQLQSEGCNGEGGNQGSCTVTIKYA